MIVIDVATRDWTMEAVQVCNACAERLLAEGYVHVTREYRRPVCEECGRKGVSRASLHT